MKSTGGAELDEGSKEKVTSSKKDDEKHVFMQTKGVLSKFWSRFVSMHSMKRLLVVWIRVGMSLIRIQILFFSDSANGVSLGMGLSFPHTMANWSETVSFVLRQYPAHLSHPVLSFTTGFQLIPSVYNSRNGR